MNDIFESPDHINKKVNDHTNIDLKAAESLYSYYAKDRSRKNEYDL